MKRSSAFIRAKKQPKPSAAAAKGALDKAAEYFSKVDEVNLDEIVRDH